MIKKFSTLAVATLGSMVTWAQTPEADVTIGESTKNTDKSYFVYSDAINIEAGKTVNLKTSRYSNITSAVSGKGRLNILSGGERTYIGDKSKTYHPDWTQFGGEVHVYKYNEVVDNAGNYGIIWCHAGKVFTPDNIEDLGTNKVNSLFVNAALTIHNEATMYAEKGQRGIRIGCLATEDGSIIGGYYKGDSGSLATYAIGYDGRDSELKGTIASGNSSKVGLIKEGKGTYKISGNNNNINGGIRIIEGAIEVANDAEAAKEGKLAGPLAGGDIVVGRNGKLYGKGHISATTDVFGTIEAGDNSTGTLHIESYNKEEQPSLRLRPSTHINIKVESTDKHDAIEVAGALEYYNIGDDFAQSKLMPAVYIYVAEGAELKIGDKLTIIRANSKASLNDVEWELKAKCNGNYTWKVAEEETDGKKCWTLTLASLENTFTLDDDESTFELGYDPYYAWDIDTEKGYNGTLRGILSGLDKHIGVAVRGWDMNLDDENQPQPQLIAKEFNAAVCENEMKFDAIHPSKDSYSFDDGDKLVRFAGKHDMYVRGHTLAWHSQVAGWVTSDGKKNSNNLSRQELLDILKDHITKTVTHWKGKVNEWDVCNEVLDENQSTILGNPSAYDLRPSVWSTGIGADFIDSAFVWAHRADPDALLILNDYDVEFKGKAKTEAMYNLAKRLKESGIPIDGVGLQCHLNIGEVDVEKLAENIRRYEELGMICNITELDLGDKEHTAASAQQQAEDFRAITNVFMNEKPCKTMMIWGLRDSQSWRNGSDPLLFDGSLNYKPAYYGVRSALRAFGANAIDEIENDQAEIERTEYYSLSGHRLENNMAKGLVIVRYFYTDGTTMSKIMIK